MFTGIIKSLGKVKDVSARGKSLYVWITKPAGWKIKAGDSISVDGICSTAKRLNDGSFEVEYMPETLKKTTAGLFKKGTFVNLELSLRANSRLDGHLVQGHVDATGDIKEIKKLGKSVILKIGFPKQYRKFIAKKGSIAVNGVSLTVVNARNDWFTPTPENRYCNGKGKRQKEVGYKRERRKRRHLVWGFTVSLMNYTLKHTNLQNLKKGDKVNVEIDVLARYLHTLIK